MKMDSYEIRMFLDNFMESLIVGIFLFPAFGLLFGVTGVLWTVLKFLGFACIATCLFLAIWIEFIVLALNKYFSKY